MIRLLFVGDSETDVATNTPIVKTIVGAEIEPQPMPWPRLDAAGRGYDRKLLFALRVARSKELDGLVATVDKDKSPGKDRLRSMKDARNKDREARPAIPTALGCADPHAEAWLLDDPVAVRTVLQLDSSVTISNVRRVTSPKDELTGLHSRSPRADEPAGTILVEIATALTPNRCQHADETGFAQFAEELRDEIGPLARR